MRIVALSRIALSLVAGAPATGAAVPSVRQIAPGAVKVAWRVTVREPDRFNARGNLLVGYTRPEIGADVIHELDADDGKLVWECRISPAGSLKRFVRTSDEMTYIAHTGLDGHSRILRINRHGEFRRGVQLLPGSLDAHAPVVETLQVLSSERMFVSVRGCAFVASLTGTADRRLIHRSLRNAVLLSTGRLLCVLSDPDRFAIYDPASATFSEVPLRGFCQAWKISRGEEPSPGRLRLYGCFCMPGASGDHETVEVVDVTPAGELIWHYLSPHALRMDKFGERTCLSYVEQVITLPGRTIVVDSFPANCRVVVREDSGEDVRRWLVAPTLPDGSVFGQKRCGLIRAQLIE